jgi:hypothetical protein
MLKDLKLTDKFVNNVLKTATPERFQEYNKIPSTIKLTDKPLKISKHAMDRFKERFFSNVSRNELTRYIQEYKNPEIKLITNRKDIVQKFYQVIFKIGSLPVKMFIIETDNDEYLVSTLYANIDDQAFVEKMLTIHKKNKSELKKKDANTKFEESLITNFFKSRKKADEFFDQHYQVGKLKTKKIKEKTSKYKGPTFEDIFNNINEDLNDFDPKNE